jgi:DnaJ-class molecular chaperone
MQEYYKILNITKDATDEEVENAYKTLKERYSKERFYEGEIGNEAAKKLTKVETAYQEIMASRKVIDDNGEKKYDFSEVETLIKKGDISSAQTLLDDIYDRNAEWHYLQSVIFYKKNWINESKKQLEIAVNMEPHNVKYSEDYAKLKQKIEFNERQFKSGNANYNQSSSEDYSNRQMGGSDMNNCLSFCATWCCVDMLCSLCCR